jgi:hypothetical protein
MSRIRSVHPGFFTDENVVSVSLPARLALIGLGIEADDKGVFQWKEKTIKMRLFPADNIDVGALLAELVGEGLLIQFCVDGRQYGAIKNFRKHQRPKSPNDLFPATEDALRFVGLGSADAEAEGVKDTAISEIEGDKVLPFPQKAEIAPQMEDGGEDGGEEEAPIPPRGGAFAEFWQRWPNKVAKSQAEKAWEKLKPAEREVAVGCCDAWFTAWRKMHPDATPIYPSTFLNQRRWEDMGEPAPLRAVTKKPEYGDMRELPNGNLETYHPYSGWVRTHV